MQVSRAISLQILHLFRPFGAMIFRIALTLGFTLFAYFTINKKIIKEINNLTCKRCLQNVTGKLVKQYDYFHFFFMLFVIVTGGRGYWMVVVSERWISWRYWWVIRAIVKI